MALVLLSIDGPSGAPLITRQFDIAGFEGDTGLPLAASLASSAATWRDLVTDWPSSSYMSTVSLSWLVFVVAALCACRHHV